MHTSEEQDGQLRRLHFFQEVGAVLAPPLRAQMERLRADDRRRRVRPPREVAVLTPDRAPA